ncbi:MAG: Crp/Fnr family transcriptional regulator [Sphingobacteriales bacterium]|nr:MAG: Crp/Fnr family transcriptional regulator [Sphingobacteriales bacterium]
MTDFHSLNPSKKLIYIEQLFSHINTFYPLSQPSLDALTGCFEKVILPRNERLVTEGSACRHMYFLQQGALRGYYNLDGREVTHWFAFENDFVTSFHSFITHRPAVENIQLIEGSVLWSITRDNLNLLLTAHHEIERLVRIIYETYYIRLEERYVNAHFKTASERYYDLLVRAPHMIERVPLGAIASYLGITQETLSRIRSKL